MITIYCNRCGINVKLYRAVQYDLGDLKAYQCRTSCGVITYIKVTESKPKKVKGIRNLKKFQNE